MSSKLQDRCYTDLPPYLGCTLCTHMFTFEMCIIFYKLTFSGGSGNFPLQSQPNFRSQQTPYLSGPSPGKSGGGINLPP